MNDGSECQVHDAHEQRTDRRTNDVCDRIVVIILRSRRSEHAHDQRQANRLTDVDARCLYEHFRNEPVPEHGQPPATEECQRDDEDQHDDEGRHATLVLAARRSQRVIPVTHDLLSPHLRLCCPSSASVKILFFTR